MRKEVWLVVAIVWSDSGDRNGPAKRSMRYAYVSEKIVELPEANAELYSSFISTLLTSNDRICREARLGSIEIAWTAIATSDWLTAGFEHRESGLVLNPKSNDTEVEAFTYTITRNVRVCIYAHS